MSYRDLISIIDLKNIKPLVFSCERLGNIEKHESDIETSISYGCKKDDPVFVENKKMICSPKLEFLLSSSKNNKIFHQISIYELVFEISDFDKFLQLWGDEKLRDIFMQQQIKKTVWPFFRQNIIDGLTRLCLPPISLPWVM